MQIETGLPYVAGTSFNLVTLRAITSLGVTNLMQPYTITKATMNVSFLKVACIVAAFSFFYSDAYAQKEAPGAPNTSGFFVHVGLNGTAWSIDLDGVESESGGGFGLGLGYTFRNNVGIFAHFDAASIEEGGESYILGHFDLGASYTFRLQNPNFKPYVLVAASGLSAQDDFIELNGSGFTAGAGFQFMLTPKLAFDLNYKYSAIELSELVIEGITLGLEADASSSRLALGLRYTF